MQGQKWRIWRAHKNNFIHYGMEILGLQTGSSTCICQGNSCPCQRKTSADLFSSNTRAETHTAALNSAALLSIRKTYFLWKACEHGHTPSSSLLQNSSKHTAHVCWKEKVQPAVNLDRYTSILLSPWGGNSSGLNLQKYHPSWSSARTNYYTLNTKTTVILLQ